MLELDLGTDAYMHGVHVGRCVTLTLCGLVRDVLGSPVEGTAADTTTRAVLVCSTIVGRQRHQHGGIRLQKWWLIQSQWHPPCEDCVLVQIVLSGPSQAASLYCLHVVLNNVDH